MSIAVRIPTPLRPLVRGQSLVHASGRTIFEVLEDLNKHYPGIRERLFDGPELRPFVNVYLNDEDIRFLQGEHTPVKEGDLVSIVPAIAGG